MQHAPPLRAHRMVHVTGLISHAVNPVIWGPKDNASFVLPPMLLQKGNDVAKPGTSATILRERSSHATLPPGSEAMHTRSKTNMHGVPSLGGRSKCPQEAFTTTLVRHKSRRMSNGMARLSSRLPIARAQSNLASAVGVGP